MRKVWGDVQPEVYFSSLSLFDEQKIPFSVIKEVVLSKYSFFEILHECQFSSSNMFAGIITTVVYVVG